MAKSLQDCLKKAEGIISRDDKAAVLRMAETGTEIGATRALFKQLINEKQAILDEIERAGGNPEEWVERLEAEEVDFNPDLNEAGAAIEREFFDWLNARSTPGSLRTRTTARRSTLTPSVSYSIAIAATG
jgi:hypothetical protein